VTEQTVTAEKVTREDNADRPRVPSFFL